MVSMEVMRMYLILCLFLHLLAGVEAYRQPRLNFNGLSSRQVRNGRDRSVPQSRSVLLASPSVQLETTMKTKEVASAEKSIQVDTVADIDTKDELDKDWRLVLHDDNINVIEEVIDMIVRIIPIVTVDRATDVVMTTHTAGQSTVCVAKRKLIEQYSDALVAKGLSLSMAPDEEFEVSENHLFCFGGGCFCLSTPSAVSTIGLVDLGSTLSGSATCSANSADFRQEQEAFPLIVAQMAEILIPFIHSFVVLDNEGDRLFAKYYDGRNKAAQTASEAVLYKKSKAVAAKLEAEVLLVDDEIIVFKAGSECKFYISGPIEENELVLVGVLDALYDTVSTLLKGQIDKRTMLDNLELILLTIDETIDSGYIMELDATAVVGRVLMKGSDTPQPQTIGDLSISQALGLARDSFFKSLVSGGRGDGY